MSILAVDVDFLHNLESDAVVDAAELVDFAVGAGVLVGKLVAGEAEHDQSAVGVFLVEFLQSVELGGETALAGGVDNHEDFAFEVGEVNLFAIAGYGFEVVYC